VFMSELQINSAIAVFPLQKPDLRDSCVAIARLPKASSESARIVLMTCGDAPVCLASPDGYSVFPCISLPSDKIKDVNGAGDAFLGGFLSQYIQNLPLDRCVAMGLYVASVVVQQDGCTFPNPPPALPVDAV